MSTTTWASPEDPVRRDSSMTIHLRKLGLALSSWPKQRKSTSSTSTATSTARSLSVTLPPAPSVTDLYRAVTTTSPTCMTSDSPISTTSSRRSSNHRRSLAVDLRLPPTPDLESPLGLGFTLPDGVKLTYPLSHTLLTRERELNYSPPVSPTSEIRDYFFCSSDPDSHPREREDSTTDELRDILQAPVNTESNSPITSASDEDEETPIAVPLSIARDTQSFTANGKHSRIPTTSARLGKEGLIVDKKLDLWSEHWDVAYNAHRASLAAVSVSTTASSFSSSAGATSGAASFASALAVQGDRDVVIKERRSKSDGEVGKTSASSAPGTSLSSARTERVIIDAPLVPRREPLSSDLTGVAEVILSTTLANTPAMTRPSPSTTPNHRSASFAGETVREVSRRRRETLEYQVLHKCGDGSGVGGGVVGLEKWGISSP